MKIPSCSAAWMTVAPVGHADLAAVDRQAGHGAASFCSAPLSAACG